MISRGQMPGKPVPRYKLIVKIYHQDKQQNETINTLKQAHIIILRKIIIYKRVSAKTHITFTIPQLCSINVSKFMSICIYSIKTDMSVNKSRVKILLDSRISIK